MHKMNNRNRQKFDTEQQILSTTKNQFKNKIKNMHTNTTTTPKTWLR